MGRRNEPARLALHHDDEIVLDQQSGAQKRGKGLVREIDGVAGDMHVIAVAVVAFGMPVFEMDEKCGQAFALGGKAVLRGTEDIVEAGRNEAALFVEIVREVIIRLDPADGVERGKADGEWACRASVWGVGEGHGHIAIGSICRHTDGLLC